MLRLLRILLTRRLRPPLGLLDRGRLRLRVMPGDLDGNLHMNNGRYFAIADLGRLDQGLRCGLWSTALRRGWKPVAGDVDARFSRSLQPFQRYELHTRLLGWDAKWFYVEHRFLLGARVAALVLVRYLFVGGNGPVTTAEVLAASGHAQASPELPAAVALWREAQQQLATQLKKDAVAA